MNITRLDQRCIDDLSKFNTNLSDTRAKPNSHWATEQILTLFPLMDKMSSLLSLLVQKKVKLQYLLQNMENNETESSQS